MAYKPKNCAKKLEKFTYFAMAVICLTMCLSACAIAPNKQGNYDKTSRSELLLNTVVSITLYDTSDTSLIDECFQLCREYELIFSRTDPESELYALNEKRDMEVSGELLELLEKSLEYCRRTEGAFDISLGAVSDMYAFGSENARVPDGAEIADAMEHAGWEKIRIEGSRVVIEDDGLIVDLGAAAKGYIADKLAVFLRERGQESAIIDLGGNIYCLGAKPDGSKFTVGLQCPFKDRTELIDYVAVEDLSVVTSGIYERGFERDGEYYHHILDPETGRPCDNGLLAVSIVAESSAQADILSTSCFALGLEKGLELINSHENCWAVFVTEDYALHYSEGFEQHKAAVEGGKSLA